MCGIIGIVGKSPVGPRIIESLRRLEYRGYDSAGAAAHVGGRLVRRRAVGKLRALDELKATLDRLKGAYALGILVDGERRLVMGARRGSPLVVGYGEGEMFIGSDALAVGPFTNRVAYLDEGDYVAIDERSARIFDADGLPVE